MLSICSGLELWQENSAVVNSSSAAVTTQASTLIQLAKQGNAQAIAALINRRLHPKGLNAKVAVKSDSLLILVEAAQVPNQKGLVDFIHSSSKRELSVL